MNTKIDYYIITVILIFSNIMLKKILYIFICITLIFIPFFKSFAIEYDSNFNPNKIVSDFLIYNHTNSMDTFQIQKFLESKGSYLATFITENAEGIQKSASEIIYNASQTYQINPQAIIVLLQKEQGLIQNSSPSQKKLDWATGYSVCDSCSMESPKIQKYKGFGKQVDNGTGALRFYKENMQKYEYIKNIGEQITIDNQAITPENYATASLYTYTPHILGNYNFWRIWQRYFGNPLAESPLDIQATVQTKYMAQIIDMASPNLNASEDEETWYWVEFLNIGTETWNNEDLKQLYLLDATKKDLIPIIDETTSFDSLTLKEPITDDFKIYAPKTNIAPGEVLRFSIPIKPKQLKTELAEYVLVIDKKGWMPGTQISYNLTRQFNFDAELIDDTMPEFSQENTTHQLKVTYKNIGTKAWDSDEIFLDWNDKTKKIQALIPMDQDKVKKGEVATFSLITKIKKDKKYDYDLKLVKKTAKDKYTDLITGKHTTTITVKNGLFAQIIDLQIPEKLNPGQIAYGRILIKNVGGITWTPNDMVLRSYGKISPFTKNKFSNDDWHSGFAIEKIKSEVKPGETYTFNFKLVAPKTAGLYEHYYQLEWGKNYTEIDLGNKTFYKLTKTKVEGSVAIKKK